ncbi:MAG: SMI1/KNR4 family protein [Deltaproteobacteria bacterium]|nr:SMI1/KNR4 family protein [Deltaproteobacteria bacterium]
MTAEELDALVENVRAKEAWQFDGQRDTPLTAATIRAIEEAEQIQLPSSFKEFLARYGAGDFVFSQVYSPDRNSGWNLWDQFQYMPDKKGLLIPFSDNGAGDYYCFPVVSGVCEDRVVWADHEQNYSITESQYRDFREFVADVCLRINE